MVYESKSGFRSVGHAKGFPLEERSLKTSGDRSIVLLAALKTCSKTRNLKRGKEVHAEVVECGHNYNVYVANALINMYAKCGSMGDGFQVFEDLKYPTVVSWTVLILGYAENGQGDTALKLFTRMKNEEPSPNALSFMAAIKACTSIAHKGQWAVCRDRGKEIHNFAVENGCVANDYVQSSLVDMYAKCGSMAHAREVFDGMKHLDVVSWNVLLLGYVDNGQGQNALDMLTRMGTEGPPADSLTLVAALKACRSLAVKGARESRDKGKLIHNVVVENGCNSDAYVHNSLLDIYAKCGSMVDACEVFDGMKSPDLVSWNVLISGYADDGQGDIALDIFTRMRTEGPAPDSITLVAALKSCSSIAVKDGASRWEECRDRGKEIHSITVEAACNSNIYVRSTLVDMYAKCGSMLDATEVFDEMLNPDVVSWNVLILGYADNGRPDTSLDLFYKMRTEGCAPNSGTFVAVLKASTSLAFKEGDGQCKHRGNKIYNIAVECGSYSDIYVQSTLLDMYTKCGFMVDARNVFEGMKHLNVVSWNVLILGYADNGQGHIALEMFVRMRTQGLAPDYLTLVACLKACTSVAVKEGASKWAECRDTGKSLLNISFENGCSSHEYVQNSLVDMYAKCGSIVDAHEVFDSMKHPTVVSWTALILGYAENGQGSTALDLLTRMRAEGTSLNSVTFVAAIKACTALVLEGASECKERGKEIHSIALESGCNFELCVRSTLVEMYAKCGSMVDARDVFDGMKSPDVVSWNVLILGYIENGQADTALDLFTRMRSKGPPPSSVTFAAALKACGLVGALEFGKTIHSEIDSGNDLDVLLVTCLVDFYAKCGSLVEAKNVFDMHADTRDIITCHALLAGFSSSGDYKNVFRLFEGMQDAGFKPDGVTFMCILTCCSHAGLVVKGKECFDAMSTIYGVIPTVKHYTCMIDLFGRANRLDDAMALLECMPCSADEVTWTTILGASCKWKNVEIGRLAFKSLIDLNGGDAAAYVLMGQIYGT